MQFPNLGTTALQRSMGGETTNGGNGEITRGKERRWNLELNDSRNQEIMRYCLMMFKL